MSLDKYQKKFRRVFWGFLNVLPAPVRTHIMRTSLDIQYTLPKNFCFKLAETEDEIGQALRLTYDAYLKLNYIEPNEEKLRLSRYHAHPGAIVLIAKENENVIATMTIIPDSAIGLPADITWDLDVYRKRGLVFAEISSLTIHNDYRKKRGQLLLPLCKLMYEFCRDYLKLDGVVAATNSHVSPFYTDILLFETITQEKSKSHDWVKGADSTCSFLSLSEETEMKGKKIYGHKKDSKNLYKFMKQFHSPNIQLPDTKLCIQTYAVNKNRALDAIIRKSSRLRAECERPELQLQKGAEVRPILRVHAWCLLTGQQAPQPCKVLDVSSGGVKLALTGAHLPGFDRPFILLIEYGEKLFTHRVMPRWQKHGSIFGGQFIDPSSDWKIFYQTLADEINSASQEKAAA